MGDVLFGDGRAFESANSSQHLATGCHQGNGAQYLDVGGYPEESDPDFKEANVSDLVCGIIQHMRKKTKRMIQTISIDNETGSTY